MSETSVDNVLDKDSDASSETSSMHSGGSSQTSLISNLTGFSDFDSGSVASSEGPAHSKQSLDAVDQLAQEQAKSMDRQATAAVSEDQAESEGGEETSIAKSSRTSVVTSELDYLDIDEKTLGSLRDIIVKRCTSKRITVDLWKEHHLETLDEFVGGGEHCLYVYLGEKNQLKVENALPKYAVKEYMCFIHKPRPQAPVAHKKRETTVLRPGPTYSPLSVENFDKEVIFMRLLPCAHRPGASAPVKGEEITAHPIEALVRVMQGVFMPAFRGSDMWPFSMKAEFIGQAHKFMCSLTEANGKRSNKTELYVPHEGGTEEHPELVFTNKELIQQLESTVILWTRQVKEVLSAQQGISSSANEGSGPLQEIEFWRNRCEDLSGIGRQLESKGVNNVITILEHAKSFYVAPFKKLSSEIMGVVMEAESNRLYLETLRDYCEILAGSKPPEIPEMLPNLLNKIRMVWTNSPNYNSERSISILLRSVFIQVIHQCADSIELQAIYEGFIRKAKDQLHAAILCCEQCKDVYRMDCKVYEGFIRKAKDQLEAAYCAVNSARMSILDGTHARLSEVPWEVEGKGTFAQIDTFIQRCYDLLQVCEYQEHFCRKVDGELVPMAVFGGQRGTELMRELNETEQTFNRHMLYLFTSQNSILDVFSVTWQEDFDAFKQGMKDIEMMLQNLIRLSFEVAVTVDQGVDLLDIFLHLSVRPSIKRALDQKVISVYTMFADEINSVKQQVLQKTHKLDHFHPVHSGGAISDKILKLRLLRIKEELEQATFLPHTEIWAELLEQCEQITSTLEQSIHKRFFNWTTSISKEPMKLLTVPLLTKSTVVNGRIDCNFSGELLKKYAEMKYWSRLQFELPNFVLDLQPLETELMILKEKVHLVVRDYNRILNSLSTEGFELFRERVINLNKKVSLGLTKLMWSGRDKAELFINESRISAGKVQQQVDDFKMTSGNFSEVCRTMSSVHLIQIDHHHIYSHKEFADGQAHHKRVVMEKLERLNSHLIEELSHMYDVFKDDGPEVQTYWYNYVEKVDRLLEESLRISIRFSLQKLLKAINNESKSGRQNILFKVYLVLEKHRLDFDPTTTQLFDLVTGLAKDLPNYFINIFRLTDQLTERKSGKEPLFETIAADSDVDKIQRLITLNMENITSRLKAYLETWDSYREVWEIKKSFLVEEYNLCRPEVQYYDLDIQRYVEVQHSVQSLDSIQTLQFIQIDCASLKFAIVASCKDWQTVLINLLHRNALQDLKKINDWIINSSKLISKPPNTMDELEFALQLWEKVSEEMPDIETRFPPLFDQFSVLHKHEIQVDDAVLENLNTLHLRWEEFQNGLKEAELMIKKQKEKFRADMLQEGEEFRTAVLQFVHGYASGIPIAADCPLEKAFAFISKYMKMIIPFHEHYAKLKKGLAIFRIDFPASNELQDLESELKELQKVWELVEEWQTNWNNWRTSRFIDLKARIMEETTTALYKRLYRLSRELQEKAWPIVEQTLMKVNELRMIMPLISDCNNPALRDRHWAQIQALLKRKFDYRSDIFTLEKIVEWEFGRYAEQIKDISGAATKELAIETGLAEISKHWETVSFEIVSHRDQQHYKIKSVDEIFQVLEEHQVKLATMKTSRFVKAFEKSVDFWERSMSLLMETVDMMTTVQKQWIYLENIFMAEDLRRQMPLESVMFDRIDIEWRTILLGFLKTKNAFKSATQKGLLDTLTKMNTTLEEMQKSLELYLDTKRHIFPRFYFISNDDLLEILSNANNPYAVQTHLKKCFDAIKSLTIVKSTMQDHFEASHMHSLDGEVVEFTTNISLTGPVEDWLCGVEKAMRTTLKEELKKCKTSLKKLLNKRNKWIKLHPGQMCITASQIQWTADVTKALNLCKARGDRKALKSMKKKQVSMLNKFSEAIRTNLTKQLRLKIVALVTMEVHSRDIIERLRKNTSGSVDPGSFEWLKELRLYWDKEVDNCIVRQTSTMFEYMYEYLGNSGRLVITPLTDRCYITLTTALYLHKGGSPKGPAGTGKTETTKDLGRALGGYVIVVNCSEGLDYKSMGRMFSGLAQTGAWGCFDEFNRINIEVLSVVAQQILSIMSALTNALPRFVFEGVDIRLIHTCGIFITMNPGYAGRTELPDNLKSMFRPISMVVPDSTLIAEIILFGEGFNNTKMLAKKVFTLYSLAIQQLSKQDHYDFGLRALVSVLRYAGVKKRSNPDMEDEDILLLSMKDMNIAKLASVDLPLFLGVVSDLFPGVDTPAIDYSKMKEAIGAELVAAGLQIEDHTIIKTIQLYETKNSRHSSMIVGQTLSGKTISWKTLQAVKGRLKAEGVAGFEEVKVFPMNPKALNLGEIYGEFDLSSNEWTDGVLSSIMRLTCSDEKPEEKWIIFDGPVDTLWIESMNSVMDDNKILTLINGERISIPEQVSLLFEVEDLSQASPATVSRCGMVYYDYINLGWMPYVESWLLTKKSELMKEELRRLFTKFVGKILEYKKFHKIKELIQVSELNSVISLCKLFDVLATPENGVVIEEEDNLPRMVELYFQFCMLWSVCASVDEEGRRSIDAYLREVDGTIPTRDTVYEYFVDPVNKMWAHWDDKLGQAWKYNPELPFYKLMVPTVDTVRYSYLTSYLVNAQYPVMLAGSVGTGKTSVAADVISSLNPRKYSSLIISLSAQTSSNNVQDTVESRLEKRTKGTYVPVGGKRMCCFLDDFNMPAKDLFGSQPPLELIRMWIDYGFWYDRKKQNIKYIKDMFLMAAMGPPGGGRTHIPRRLLSRFNLINMTFPQESQIKRIFGSMISQRLRDFTDEVRHMPDVLTQATIDMYWAVVARFLPTPTKIHYLFNLRDISKVFQGLMRAKKTYHDTKNVVTRLWIHECFRVFSDRLVDKKDMEDFVGIMTDKLGTEFDQTFHNICPNKESPIFGDYMSGLDLTYEDIRDGAQLKQALQRYLVDYNNSPGVVAMDLVLFRDAIDHVSRIVRVIRQPRGNMLLIGIGGSGRQSLTRLASMMCEYDVFQVEISRHYRKQEFRDDLRKLYFEAGVNNKETTFLFMDVQITEESFLEDINNILSSGEVSNLYKPDEFEEVKNALIEKARKEGVEESNQALYKFLIERVRSNLHIVLGMSPVGEAFRNRIRMYPALVNCTTIDWFSEWPEDALLEVADKYLSDLEMVSAEQEVLKPALAEMFAMMHSSVAQYSRKMLVEMKRHNYVTPTNYLELVDGYKHLLYEKRDELSGAANKLKNGLNKIEETRVKVESMSTELEAAKVKVLQFQHECDEFLIVIVQQKREADEQQKSVAQKSAKIAEEEIKCQHMADLAQADLEEAMPALEEAIKALEALNKKDLTEIKSYGKPPMLVEKVMEAVMILRGSEPTWVEVKKQLGDPSFIKELINFDKDNISDRVLKKIGGYVIQSDFQGEIVGRQSAAAKSLCLWVRAMELYGRIYRVVEPKRQKMYAALAQLQEKQALLQEAKEKLAEVERKMNELKKAYDEKVTQKEELRRKAEHTEMMLDRASQLVSGLSAERERWIQTVEMLEGNMVFLVGDVLLSSAFSSYMGPFLSEYREEIVYDLWLKKVASLQIPLSEEYELCKFMVQPTVVRDWNIQGLPGDNFSTENGVIVTRGRRWALMVDPQSQAHKWIKNMEGPFGLAVIDLQMHDYMKYIEQAVQFGKPVLMQNVSEKLDASLDPILNKSVVKIAGVPLIRLGDKDIEYNNDFRFYMTTKLSNPHYSPEVATKTTIVNFAVKEQGLMSQLLGIVVRKERPDLEEMKDQLVRSIADGKKKLKQLEDMILRLLNEAKGSLLDDEELLITLQTSKVTSQEVKRSLVVSEETEAEIDAARQGYLASAERAAILFFVLKDLGTIDPMYQFSLDAYIDVFNLSISKSQASNKLEERINHLNDYHTYAVYRYACRGLFERHKLLFSFHMCVKIMEAAGTILDEEYSFFLRGGVSIFALNQQAPGEYLLIKSRNALEVKQTQIFSKNKLVLDRETQMDNPCPFLTEQAWDNISELDKLMNFHGMVTSFEQYSRDWYEWFVSPSPETSALPGEWENSCNELQRMVIVRSLRPDRVTYCVSSFVVNNLGNKFTEPPVLELLQVVSDSTQRTPLIFVLSPGVDPTNDLIQVAEARGLSDKFFSLSLGQGQAPVATKLIMEGRTKGHWVFLANCHLSLSWMPQLDKIIDDIQNTDPPPHKKFRLWLSSSPHPEFPIAILQAGIKMTTEPPKGLRANMKRLYQRITTQQFSRSKVPEKYKKLLFSLCYFHSVLIERRKFLMLGWNVTYDFNDSDFEVSENLLCLYLDEYEETPWEALKFLIASINYGGHVTDDWDRRLLITYIADYFTEEVISTPFYKLSPLPHYFIPKDGSLNSYIGHSNVLPPIDHPEAFGQHPNADITSQIQEARGLFETLLSLQPATGAGSGGESREDMVLELAENIRKQIPDNINYDDTVKIMINDNSPLKVVLLQEIERYNILLNRMRAQLIDLNKGIQGLVVMSSDLEEIFICVYEARVPPSWEKAYPSLKPLASWTRDLVQRVEQFSHWALTARPPVIFWLAAFTFPNGFLTAVLQTSARQNSEGVLVKGLYLQGAGWDIKQSILIEAEPMQLVCPIPTIHFKPVEAKRRPQRGVYACPCYYYPKRAGTSGRPSYVVAVDLKSGEKPPEHWVKRGTALLMSLDT